MLMITTTKHKSWNGHGEARAAKSAWIVINVVAVSCLVENNWFATYFPKKDDY